MTVIGKCKKKTHRIFIQNIEFLLRDHKMVPLYRSLKKIANFIFASGKDHKKMID